MGDDVHDFFCVGRVPASSLDAGPAEPKGPVASVCADAVAWSVVLSFVILCLKCTHSAVTLFIQLSGQFSALGDDETAGSYRGSLVSETPTSKPTLCSNLAGFLRRHLLPIALGQLLSALLCITSITSTYLVNFNVNLPIAQNLSHYVLLGLVYSSIVLWRLLSAHSTSSSFWKFLRCRGWQYALVGTIDVHANWAIVSAYDYTNMTSIQLLDCLAIPAAMMLSFFCLKTRYRWIHIVGVLVCLGGAGAMVLADFLAAKDTEATTNTTVSRSSSSVLFGDFLVIVAALGYGSSNVYQEYLVRRYGIVDYLSCTSVVAMVWAAIYTLTMERGTIDQLIAIYDQVSPVF